MSLDRRMLARRPVIEQTLHRVIVGAELTPLKSEPTVVTLTDIAEYRDELDPLYEGLAKDFYANVVYMSADDEHNQEEALLTQAKAWDGCDQGLTCPGWRPEDPEPSATNIPGQKARALRQEAYKHMVNARLMEDRIKARGLTNAQAAAETSMYNDFHTLYVNYKSFVASIIKLTLFKGSDFKQMQSYDVQLQAMRQRYQSLTGLAPSTPLPTKDPAYESSGIPWVPIIALSTAIVVLMFWREIKAFIPTRAVSTKPVLTRVAA